jgi:hypothetical protein
MIKIKITDVGGYVVGDGPCPFNPDEFMAAFIDQIMDARRAGLNEIGISDEDIEAFKQNNLSKLRDAHVTELSDSATPTRILDAIAAALMPPLVVPDRFDV